MGGAIRKNGWEITIFASKSKSNGSVVASQQAIECGALGIFRSFWAIRLYYTVHAEKHTVASSWAILDFRRQKWWFSVTTWSIHIFLDAKLIITNALNRFLRARSVRGREQGMNEKLSEKNHQKADFFGRGWMTSLFKGRPEIQVIGIRKNHVFFSRMFSKRF